MANAGLVEGEAIDRAAKVVGCVKQTLIDIRVGGLGRGESGFL